MDPKREEIIKRGLADRNENVRNVVSKDLVPSWLRFCNENIVELLYALGTFINQHTPTRTQPDFFYYYFEIQRAL